MDRKLNKLCLIVTAEMRCPREDGSITQRQRNTTPKSIVIIGGSLAATAGQIGAVKNTRVLMKAKGPKKILKKCER